MAGGKQKKGSSSDSGSGGSIPDGDYTKMVFAGLKKPDKRADIIKYIEVEAAKKPSA